MANVNVAAEEILPQAGADSKGRKLGLIDSVAKVAQNDTVTVTNAINNCCRCCVACCVCSSVTTDSI